MLCFDAFLSYKLDEVNYRKDSNQMKDADIDIKQQG